jgi:general secretion pathway protein D
MNRQLAKHRTAGISLNALRPFQVASSTAARIALAGSILLPALGSLTFDAHAQAPGGQAAAAAASDDDVPAGATEINLKNAEISSIIRIFSRKTGRNYILDENVKGKVTIYLPGQIQTGEAVKMLDALLALKGFTSVPIGENLWKIVANKDAKTSTIPTLQGLDGEPSASAAMVTRIVQLKYSGADEVKQLVTPLISPDGLLNAYTGTNSLIIIDSQDNIDRVVGIIETLDVPSSDREMTIIPVNNAEATAIADKLNEILGVGGGKEGDASSLDLLRNRIQEGFANAAIKNMNNAGGTGGAALNASATGRTVTARSREPKITADERTNSVVVIADEDTTARVRALVAQLDSKVDRSGNKFYVYRCQHASAEELAEVLSSLGGGGGGGSSGGKDPAADFFGSGAQDSSARGSMGGGASKSRARSKSRLESQNRNPGESRKAAKTGGASSASLGEDISITADPSTNSLVIYASKPDYFKVLELLSQLDIKRRQVLVEATLLEVAIDGSLSTGLSFMGSTGGADGGGIIKNDAGGDLTRLLRDPTSVQNFSVAAASAGSLKLPNGTVIPTQSILLNAAQSNRNVNVLSAPTILTTDNEEAEIVVGQNVPFISSTSTNDTNLNNTFNQVDRQDVGITLRLTPQISSGDFVTLKIFTEVSDLVPGTSSSTLGPTTTVRTSETTVITKDSQMVVIGGLMSDDVSDGEAGIPYLKDIPVLGHLFKQSSSEHRRTNLLIFITPRVIKDQFDHRELTLTARDKLETELLADPEQPNRSEVLRRDELSNVAEGKIVDGPKPSTILPPLETSSLNTGSSLKTGPRSRSIEAPRVESPVASSSDGAIELRIKPKAPAKARENAGKLSTDLSIAPQVTAPKDEPARAPAKPAVLVPAKPEMRAVPEVRPPAGTTERVETPLPAGGERFVILEAVRGTAAGKLSGVVIPDGAPPTAELFFAQEQVIEKDGTTYRSRGLFRSEADARNSSSKGGTSPSSWQRLSPHELLKLGSGPWRRGTALTATPRPAATIGHSATPPSSTNSTSGVEVSGR